MRSGVNTYVEAVLENIAADENMKKRIEKDLLSHINEACGEADLDTIIRKMGVPKDVAKEFMDNIYEDKEDVMERLIQEQTINNKLQKDFYEYKSEATLFGLPLIHIKLNRHNSRMGVAKGILAIGNISVGVLSIGGVAAGGICIGGVGVGLVSLGGLALGALAAVGGVAIGSIALGGCAIGLAAIGGAAYGKIAFGGFAKGVVAIGGKAIGDYAISGTEVAKGQFVLGEVSKKEIADLIRAAYPNISNWVIKLFTMFGA